MGSEDLTYHKAGVNINAADAAKAEMAKTMAPVDPRVLTRPRSFAALFEANFPGIHQPVLVLKAEEPGSKQLLAFQHNRISGSCYDLVNHLVNDVIVMGAKPEAVLDVILCGKLEPQVIVEIVREISEACREQNCSLVGGETSEQPRVLPSGTYMLSATMVGVVDKDKIIDGSRIRVGDCVVGLASNGVHTNGYSLIRRLIEDKPDLIHERVGDESLLDAILRPHRCYYQELRDLLDRSELHGLAHITGGGIGDNLERILPEGVTARIDLGKIQILPVFHNIRSAGNISDLEMLRVFNMGVGMIAVVDSRWAATFREYLTARNCHSYVIGEIVQGNQAVVMEGKPEWRKSAA